MTLYEKSSELKTRMKRLHADATKQYQRLAVAARVDTPKLLIALGGDGGEGESAIDRARAAFAMLAQIAVEYAAADAEQKSVQQAMAEQG